jgi:hypothetical protein
MYWCGKFIVGGTQSECHSVYTGYPETFLMGFLFTTESKPDLGPTQPPVQWILGALSSGFKWLGA